MTAKISLVIITRNRSAMLKRCLLSIVNQTKVPDEVIVVDNASSDDTKKIILSFSKKLPIKYVLEKRIGIPYARNRGIKESHGSIILMTDDDCEADKNWVEGMVNAHKKYPKAWAIQGRTYSLPKKRIYSIIAEFKRIISFQNFSKKKFSLDIEKLFNKYLSDEQEYLTCDTKNFSIKSSYINKYHLLFDESFYRGSDTDLAKQILKLNGMIMFYPKAVIAHQEKINLKIFLEKRWHFGRIVARKQNKWKEGVKVGINPLSIFLILTFFCDKFNQWHNFPILIGLLLLDRFFYISGWVYEKING